jgi:digeranylgeranylglycerophospholipid reductase
MLKLYDVIVIGGGPVGSYVAFKLAEMGHGVAVLERHKQPGEQVCCTGIISQKCITAFAIDENVILRQANSAKLFSPSGTLIRLWREQTQAGIVDRAALDMAIAGRAQDKGAEYLPNSLTSDIQVGDDRVRVEAVRQGKKLNLEARAAVVATGSGSKLVERLGLGKVGDFVTGAQAEVETDGIDEVEVYLGQETAPGFFAWLVPTSPPKALAGLLSRHSPQLYLKRLMSSLQAQGKIARDNAEPCYRGIPLKPLPRTYGERLLVVGDAAGQVKPTTGGGIYYGLLCAHIAADTLHHALKDDNLSAKTLANYQRRWRKKLGRELEISYYARKLYERLSDKQVERMFNLIKSHGIDQALLQAEDLAFDWHGEAVIRLMGHKIVANALRAMKAPFSFRRQG